MASADIDASPSPGGTPSSSGGGPSGAGATDHLDERLVARAALEAAEERLRSLCAVHAPTFVAVERRGAALESALRELLERAGDAEPNVGSASRALGGEEDADGKGGGGGAAAGAGGTEGEAKSASASLAALAERHRLRRRTLLQHSSLLELLELPSLMDACVRSNLYDEALSVAGFANTLERRHLLGGHGEEDDAPGASGRAHGHGAAAQGGKQQHGHKRNDVVANVVSEVRRRERDLRRHLLHRLRADVTMPQCLEVVTALRRLNGVELERRGHRATTAGGGHGHGGGGVAAPVDLERVHSAMELRLMVDFLEARDAWLDSGSRAPPSAAAAAVGSAGGSSSRSLGKAASGADGKSEQLLDGIERYRTRTFEIATQFLAIFRADSGASLSPSSSSTEDPSLSLLSMWTTRRVHLFLSRLRRDLSSAAAAGAGADGSGHLDASALRDALDAASFFAASMGRVGADFRPLLPPIFEPRVAGAVTRRWSDGASALRETLRACRDAGVASPLFGTVTEGGGAEVAEREGLRRTESGGGAAAAGGSGTPPPPRRLLSLPPLARLVNSHLSGLNELRRCLLPGTFPSLRRSLDSVIGEVRQILQTNERAVLTPGLRGEAARLREAAGAMREEFGKTAEPYMRRSLEVAFGSLDLRDEEEEKKEEEDEEKEKEEDKEENADSGEKEGAGTDGVEEKAEGGEDAGETATAVEEGGDAEDEAKPAGDAVPRPVEDEGVDGADGGALTDAAAEVEADESKNEAPADGVDEGEGGGEGEDDVGEGWDDDNLDEGLYD